MMEEKRWRVTGDGLEEVEGDMVRKRRGEGVQGTEEKRWRVTGDGRDCTELKRVNMESTPTIV